jgi:hypothetical protein
MKLKTLGALSFTLLWLAFLSLACPGARANTITFDDLTGFGLGEVIPNGYQGLDWSNFSVLNTQVETTFHGPNGYANGVVSGLNVAVNGNGLLAAVSASSPFTLGSGYFTAAWTNGLTVDVIGYLHGTQVDSTSFLVSASGPTLETFNWANVNEVTFNSFGGTPAGYASTGTEFALDNLAITPGTAVPEFGTLASFAGILTTGGLALLRRARKNNGAHRTFPAPRGAGAAPGLRQRDRENTLCPIVFLCLSAPQPASPPASGLTARRRHAPAPPGAPTPRRPAPSAPRAAPVAATVARFAVARFDGGRGPPRLHYRHACPAIRNHDVGPTKSILPTSRAPCVS